MLEVRKLRAGYGAVEVLRGIDLDVARGEIVAVLGANGVGKTTLNKVLSGMLPVSEGSVTFEGVSLGGSPIAAVDAGLIHVPEGRKIFPNMSVRENLELGSYRGQSPAARKTWNMSSRFSLACGNAPRRRRGRCRVASSRCSPSGAA